MFNEIPWYITVFISLPETFLLNKVGLNLFNLDMSWKKNLIVSCIVASFSYVIRKYFIIFGIHTILSAILITILVSFFSKIKLVHALIATLLGVLITGTLQSFTVSIILSAINKTLNALEVCPQLNMILFIPNILAMILLIAFISKKNFYLFDLTSYSKD